MPTIETLTRLPGVRQLLRRRFARRFEGPHGAGACRGVHASFAGAAAAAPSAGALGYDHAAAAELYEDLLGEVRPKDYPVLFWLRDAIDGATRLFDYGGHVGLAYYAYRTRLALPPALVWTVCDVPSVAARGEQLAASRGVAGSLRFTGAFGDADGADVLLAAGSLQYIETPLDTLLSTLAAPPTHLLVNQTPTTTGAEFWTVQHIGVAYCPYRIANRDALPTALAARGYELVDRWHDPSRTFRLPYEPAVGPIEYTGYYLRRRRSAAG